MLKKNFRLISLMHSSILNRLSVYLSISFLTSSIYSCNNNKSDVWKYLFRSKKFAMSRIASLWSYIDGNLLSWLRCLFSLSLSVNLCNSKCSTSNGILILSAKLLILYNLLQRFLKYFLDLDSFLKVNILFLTTL